MQDREIIGIDHGNRNMKTVQYVFSASVAPILSKPDNLENVLEFRISFIMWVEKRQYWKQ